jgi:hypothetical protein
MKTKNSVNALRFTDKRYIGFFAQDTTKLVKKQMVKGQIRRCKKDSVYYTCTMHPDVKMDKPG